jgi:hypothetical protein
VEILGAEPVISAESAIWLNRHFVGSRRLQVSSENPNLEAPVSSGRFEKLCRALSLFGFLGSDRLPAICVDIDFGCQRGQFLVGLLLFIESLLQ